MTRPALIAALALAALLPSEGATAQAGKPPLEEAAHAIDVGRLDQARLMIAKAVEAGAAGAAVDRLIADLAFASGDHVRAAALYEPLLAATRNDARLFERAGIAALRIGNLDKARLLLARATELTGASWRAWNARGVAADYARDWATADAAYAQALRIAPDRPEILNNRGWSLLLRMRWTEALAVLEQAHARDPKSRQIADNLQLARMAVSDDLPQRLPGESDADWSARLNDAGVVAQARGDRARAIAAFTQAIDSRSQWFERAANNLDLVQGKR